MDYREVKDSGEWREFDLGSVRDQWEGKGWFDFIFFCGFMLTGLVLGERCSQVW